MFFFFPAWVVLPRGLQLCHLLQHPPPATRTRCAGVRSWAALAAAKENLLANKKEAAAAAAGGVALRTRGMPAATAPRGVVLFINVLNTARPQIHEHRR